MGLDHSMGEETPRAGIAGAAGQLPAHQEEDALQSSALSSPTLVPAVPANSWQLRVGSKMKFKAVPWSKAPWSKTQLVRQSILKQQTAKHSAAKQVARRRPFSAAAQRWWINKSQMASDRANFIAASALDEDMVLAAVSHALQRTQLLAQQLESVVEVEEQAPPQTAWDFMLDVFDQVRNESATIIQRAYRQHLAAKRHLEELRARRSSDGSKGTRSLTHVTSRYMEGVLPGTSRRQSQVGSYDGSQSSKAGHNENAAEGTSVASASNLMAAAFQNVVQRAMATPPKRAAVAKPVRFAELPPMEKARRALAPMLRYVYEVAAQLLAQSKGTDTTMAAAAAALRVQAGSPGPDKRTNRSATASPDLIDKCVPRAASRTGAAGGSNPANASATTGASGQPNVGPESSGNLGMIPGGADVRDTEGRAAHTSQEGDSAEHGIEVFGVEGEEEAFVPVQRSPTFLSLMFGQDMALVQSITLAADAHGAAGMLQAIREQAETMQVDLPLHEQEAVPQMQLIQQLMQQAEDVRASAQDRRDGIASEYNKHVERIAAEAERVKQATELMLQPREPPARNSGWREQARSAGEEEYRRMVSAANRVRRVEQGLSETEAVEIAVEPAVMDATMGNDSDSGAVDPVVVQQESKLRRAKSRAAAKQQAAAALHMRQVAAVMAAVSRTRRSSITLANKAAASAHHAPTIKAMNERSSSMSGAAATSQHVGADTAAAAGATTVEDGQGDTQQVSESADGQNADVWPESMADAGVNIHTHGHTNLTVSHGGHKLSMAKQRPGWGLPTASFNSHAGWTNDWGPMGFESLHLQSSKLGLEASKRNLTLKTATIGGSGTGPGQEVSSKKGWYYDAWGLPVLVRGGTLEALGPVEPIEPQWQAKPAPARAPPSILPRLIDPVRNKSIRQRRQTLVQQARASTPPAEQSTDLQGVPELADDELVASPRSVHQPARGSWILDPQHAPPGSPQQGSTRDLAHDNIALQGQGLLDIAEQEPLSIRLDSEASTLLPALSLSGQGPLQIELPQHDLSGLSLQGRVMAQCSPRSRSLLSSTEQQGGSYVSVSEQINHPRARSFAVGSQQQEGSGISARERAGNGRARSFVSGSHASSFGMLSPLQKRLSSTTVQLPSALQLSCSSDSQQGGPFISLASPATGAAIPTSGAADMQCQQQEDAAHATPGTAADPRTSLPSLTPDAHSPHCEASPADHQSSAASQQSSLPPIALSTTSEQTSTLMISMSQPTVSEITISSPVKAVAVPTKATLPANMLFPTCVASPEVIYSSTSEGGAEKHQAGSRVWKSQVRTVPAGLMLGPRVSSGNGGHTFQHTGDGGHTASHTGPASPVRQANMLSYTVRPVHNLDVLPHTPQPARHQHRAMHADRAANSDSGAVLVRVPDHTISPLFVSASQNYSAGGATSTAKVFLPMHPLKAAEGLQNASVPMKSVSMEGMPVPVLQSLVMLQPSKTASWYEPGSIRKAGALGSRLAQYQKAGSIDERNTAFATNGQGSATGATLSVATLEFSSG